MRPSNFYPLFILYLPFLLSLKRAARSRLKRTDTREEKRREERKRMT